MNSICSTNWGVDATENNFRFVVGPIVHSIAGIRPNRSQGWHRFEPNGSPANQSRAACSRLHPRRHGGQKHHLVGVSREEDGGFGFLPWLLVTVLRRTAREAEKFIDETTERKSPDPGSQCRQP